MSEDGLPALAGNDFEPAVFGRYPRLRSIKRQLQRLGAEPAMMTGSGSALFGLFSTREKLEEAIPFFKKEKVFRFAFVSRGGYSALWRRRLRAYIKEELWPPPSSDAT